MVPTAFLVLLYLAAYSSGLRLKIEGRHNVQTRHELLRRGNMDGTSALNNNADISYYTNLTLGGEVFTALVDTGSSDLWVAGSITDSVDTGATSGVSYAVGGVKGPIKTSTLQFAGYTVQDQAFLQVTPDSDNAKGTGLLGLGPTSGSNIYTTLNTSAGYAVLDRIFLQNTSTPNYLTVLLGRTQDPTDVFPGDISIGELIPGYSSVENEPKLDVTIVPVRASSDQHFQILLDQNGLLGSDGQPASITTEVQQTSNSKQATAVVDTGFSLSQVPKSVADAIYSRFSGAEYHNITGIGEAWLVPCDQEVNITFKFSSISYPIHPLDATMDPSLLGLTGVVNSEGQSSCIGSFQPISFSTPGAQTYDMILGMSFLRNVYAVFNYGDFIAEGNDTSNRGDPYVQFLSTTDPTEAHSDFVTVRLNGNDTTGGQTLNGPTSSGSGGLPRAVYFGIAAGVLGLGLLLMVCAFFMNRRKKRGSTSYRPISSPSPPVDMQLHANPPRYSLPPQYDYASSEPYHDRPQMPAQAQLYDPQHSQHMPSVQYGGSYQNPWDGAR
ncbi:aspartic peptidase domain-containing protein [Desarmillaria tabescens]|uniref:Aspartic peptidase domain-containing protein n=1 Tax=Armillaria tabescens TaxID=1929756 RepID=A0AA39TUZ0_ARMTA|nr:aspartic peptidase domain-containing protein [Desarmillaria tabescens]KAK0464234.1 aspartic peptidase domain-containing protein [Desarmillaria tabescens]